MKRILLLDHHQFTHSTFFLWHGLRELEEYYPNDLEVSLYPYIPTHYDEQRFTLQDMPWYRWLSGLVEEWRRNPSNLPPGIPPFQQGEFLTAQNVTEIIRNENAPRLFHKRNIIPDEETAVRHLREGRYDLVILGMTHRVPTILYSRLRQLVSNMPPLVFLDGGERDELNEHWVHAFRPKLTFKQILTPEVQARGLSTKIPGYDFKIYPLPLSSPLVDQNIDYSGVPLQWLRRYSNCRVQPKVFPAFYHMGATWPERANVMAALNQWVSDSKYSVARGGSTGPYHILLAMSRMAVSMRGSGRDTMRYWEIPLYQTALVSDGTMGCIHPYPFEDRKTAFFYRSIDEMIEILNRNMRDERELIAVAEAGQQHLEKYHSTAARAVFFLDILDQEINFLDPQLREDLKAWKRGKGREDRPWQGPVV